MRGIFELNASLMMSPLLMRAPRGDGHPVLALPGFLASDLSMAPMRRYLTELGYDAHAWQMGRNLGGMSRVRGALRDRLAAAKADCPLFDTDLFRRHIEAAYRGMWQRFAQGTPPQTFTVLPG